MALPPVRLMTWRMAYGVAAYVGMMIRNYITTRALEE